MIKFMLPSNGWTFTHIWGRNCNLHCDFCLNEGINNIKENELKNYKIAKIQQNLSNILEHVIYVEHGGELLFCTYVDQLLQYKIDNIPNYRSWLFTNATNFKKYKKLIDRFNKNIEFFISFHFEKYTSKQIKECLQCIDYTIEKTGFCNIAIVFHTKLNIKEYQAALNLLQNKPVFIKVWYDYHIFDLPKHHVIKALISSMNYMEYLDNNFQFNHMIENELDKKFCDIPINYLKHKYIDRNRISIENINDKTDLIINNSTYQSINIANIECILCNKLNQSSLKIANSIR